MLDDRELIALVEEYFAGVDAMDWERIQKTLAPECIIRIRTHNITHSGRDIAIRKMFEGLFARYPKVWHGDFRHLPQAELQRIASQFQVINTLPDGTLRTKDNCNFFTVREGIFSKIDIYMSGENTLT
ncbi:MAG: nuclear transport factor 2 family protein [bacterium]|jgi:hypothetical protein